MIYESWIIYADHFQYNDTEKTHVSKPAARPARCIHIPPWVKPYSNVPWTTTAPRGPNWAVPVRPENTWLRWTHFFPTHMRYWRRGSYYRHVRNKKFGKCSTRKRMAYVLRVCFASWEECKQEWVSLPPNIDINIYVCIYLCIYVIIYLVIYVFICLCIYIYMCVCVLSWENR